MVDMKIGDTVRRSFDSKIGMVEEIKPSSMGFNWIKVRFSDGLSKCKESDLELVQKNDIFDQFCKGQFSGKDLLERSWIYERIKGDITNIFYSMNNGSVEFLPHQFLPVMKFIESQNGRLLIADEVGLGKTIEAMYIWQELVARENSRRLLIVCPAMLKDKWLRDMRSLFSIDAEIVDAKTLHEKIARAEVEKNLRFALIAGIEGIRYKESVDGEGKNSPQKSLNETLKRLEGEPIFDLVVVDEAHNLRNSGTANNKTVSRIRDVSNNLILLSATPIQTSADNLYTLLNILDPDFFENKLTFQEMLVKSQSFIRLSNALGKDENSFEGELNALPDPLTKEALVCELNACKSEIFADPNLKVRFQKLLNQEVFYAPYFSRTRRKQAITECAKRNAVTWTFDFSREEKEIYRKITQMLEERMREIDWTKDRIFAFTLITRQRQMTSCMPAAFSSWRNGNFGKELEDMLYENGLCDEENEVEPLEEMVDFGSLPGDESLRKIDSKYSALKQKISDLLQKKTRKIIIFSFYRGTVLYLEERLKEDGIECISLVGGTAKKRFKARNH